MLQLSLAYRMITDEELPDGLFEDKLQENFTFEQFCCLISEYRHKKKSVWRRIMNRMLHWWPISLFGECTATALCIAHYYNSAGESGD